MDVKIVFILAPLAGFCLSSFLIEFASIFYKIKTVEYSRRFFESDEQCWQI